jgi:hypothetical protein
MIYILSGNDTKNKNAYLKKLYKNNLPVFVPSSEATKEKLFEYSGSVSLFGEPSVIVLDNIIGEENIEFTDKDLSVFKNSSSTFVFLEDKLPVPDAKKYGKYAAIEDFSKKAIKQGPKMDFFGIADAFSRKDKVGTWILYRNAISQGTAPEEISGILFWKIKTMLLNGSRIFLAEELKNKSSELVALYHRAHRGECDFVVGLEQFILSSLSK